MKEVIKKVPSAIETQRLLLKKYQSGDGKNFFRLMQQNRSRLKDSFPISLAASDTEENAELWVQKKVKGWLEGTMYSFAIVDNASGAYIGDSIIKNIDWKIPKAEIGYCITKEFEGRGLMQEVLWALNEFAFETLGFERLYLKIAVINSRSSKLAERCGYKLEGVLKNDYRSANGTLRDVCCYGLTKGIYEKEKKS
ncbi:MAG: GNAT family N-acetyltransferase [Bacteroidota bacterium]|nr:GNAT family N-acetyltransferase [Bacteroidota bacterium]